MTLNARFILKCALWTARLTYFVAGFGFDHRQLGIGVARGAKAEWAGRPSPLQWAADALFLCDS